jgi:hypothetical protein
MSVLTGEYAFRATGRGIVGGINCLRKVRVESGGSSCRRDDAASLATALPVLHPVVEININNVEVTGPTGTSPYIYVF